MEDIWNILEMEPTKEISVIRQAYAQKTKACHPEENPEGFLELRKAYQAALAYAEREEAPSEETADGFGIRETEDEGWTLSGRPRQGLSQNPYTDHEAIQRFVELYTSKQRKDSKQWLDYFTSDAFLDVAWDGYFTALLLEQINQFEGEYPVNREFLIWLCAAYQFTVSRAVYWNPDGTERTEFGFQIHPGAQFDGQESVFEIATKGPAPKQLKGNEAAVFDSFTEYRCLIRIAKEGIWSEQEIGECSKIIGCYTARYITDKCKQPGDMDCERHPAGLRLMTHFFRLTGLPDELYHITWQKLDLETAVMGRAKILYGPLRELILERLPELAQQQKKSYEKLRTDFRAYSISTYKRNGENAKATEEDIQKTDAFFAREDFKRALLERRFAEEEMLHEWLAKTNCDYYLMSVIQFYTQHENAPCAKQIVGRAQEMLKGQELAERLRKDREDKISKDALTLKNSPFFRHWLNTGFYRAEDPESGRGLLGYVNQELPYLPEQSREFLEVTEDGIRPVIVTCALGEDAVEISFHLRYMAFMLNQEPVYRACLSWERVKELKDTDTFFFCLPIAVTTYDQYEAVKTEILQRLQDTAAPEDGRSFIASCLAGQVCSLPLPGEAGLSGEMDEEDEPEIRDLLPESVLPFEVFAEDTEHLYGCEWIEHSQVLLLFEQFSIGRQLLRDGQYDDVTDARRAAALARQLLAETLAPPRLSVESLVNLPEAVYANPDFNAISRDQEAKSQSFWIRPVELLGEAVTDEKLEELLTQFDKGWLERLELSWKSAVPLGEKPDYDSRRSLVFIKEHGEYACLYFDDAHTKSYALLEKPELYGKENSNTILVPFHRGRLFNDVIHRSFSSIRRRLDVIFKQVSWPNGVQYMAGGIWVYAVNVSEGRSKYTLDKQLLADFPMERANNRQDAPFYFFMYPDSAVCVNDQGCVERMEVDQKNRSRLQQMLNQFLAGSFKKLRLTWGKKEGRRKHIVVLQDSRRFLMVWLLEEERTVQYHVADVSIYLDVEGKKYPKDIFQGRITPAYLIHDGVMPLRNALELLLANLDEPTRVTGEFAEYADEKPAKARSYEQLWADLVGDTLE